MSLNTKITKICNLGIGKIVTSNIFSRVSTMSVHDPVSTSNIMISALIGSKLKGEILLSALLEPNYKSGLPNFPKNGSFLYLFSLNFNLPCPREG